MSSSTRHRVVVLVALAVVAALAVSWWSWAERDEDSRSPAGSAPTSTPSSTPSTTPSSKSPSPEPTSLSDLPEGEPASISYVTGRVLTVGSRRVTLRERPASLVESAFTVVVRYRDGSVDLVSKPSLGTRRIADSSGSSPIVDPNGNLVAWLTADPGSATAVLHALRNGDTPLDRQSFPALPQCCDDPFQILGMSQYGDLYTSWPAHQRAWVWDVYEGQEGIPNQVPDSDEFVTRVRGLGGGLIAQVTACEVVVQYQPRTKTEVNVYGVGYVRDGRYRQTQQIEAVIADFNDPSARRIVYWTDDGRGHITGRTSGPGVRRNAPADTSELALGLPSGIDVFDVRWEDGRHFLVVTEARPHEQTVVRCDVGDGRCEIAGRFTGDVLLATR